MRISLLFCLFLYVLGRRQGSRYNTDTVDNSNQLDEEKLQRLAELLSKQFGSRTVGAAAESGDKSRTKDSVKKKRIFDVVQDKDDNGYDDVGIDSKEDDEKSIAKNDLNDLSKQPTIYKGSSSNNKAKKLLLENLPLNLLRSNYYFYSNSTKKLFPKETLVYITPWNRNGYQLAIAAATKITWLVPVWLQIRRSNDGKLFIDGKHDIDNKWLLEIREKSEICPVVNVEIDVDGDNDFPECSSQLKILPRVVLETTLKDIKELKEVTKLLIQLKKYSNFDGYTLELPLGAEWHTSVEIPRLLKKQDASCLIIVILPAVIVKRGDESVLVSLLQLGINVDRFSVMTYDLNKMQSLPNAPIGWVRDVISSLSPEVDSPLGGKASLRSKLLLGVPLYGWRGQEALTGQDMAKWLATGRVIPLWDDSPKEHRFEEQTTGLVCYYPTPMFLQHRLGLAIELDVAGVALWELGQSWPVMLDLL